MPDRMTSLMRLLTDATGWSPERIRRHHHFRQAISFSRFAAAYRPDYLHSYFFYEGTFFCLVASYLLGIPRGVSAYADHVLDDYELKVMPLHLGQASLLIATSRRIKEELLSLGSCPDPERILVKPNAVDARRFAVPGRSFRERPPHRLLAVCRIDPKKGLEYLVEAILLLTRRGIDVELSVVGAADDVPAARAYADTLDAQITAAGLNHQIRRLGFRTHDEVRSLLATADVWVGSAVVADNGDKDGIPSALLEAMAAGLPVVTTDAGSILEVVEDGVSALVVPQKDAVAFADAIQRLLAARGLAERLGRAAEARVQAEFDVVECEARFHRRLADILRG
jgi:glycosyltransferase involved in cell wall biosynthesis